MDHGESRITAPGAAASFLRALVLVAVAAAVGLGVVSRAGITRSLFQSFQDRLQGRQARTVLRVWDWWSPSTSEKYAAYFGEIETEFERRYPDVDLLYQFVPFAQYEQKMATGLVGNTPPDVFQSSVSWAEGFYDRGMLRPLNTFLERERSERERKTASGQFVDTGNIVDSGAFLEAAWRHNTKPDGTVFGIPQILDANALTWNMDLLQRAAESHAEVRALFLRRPDGSPDFNRLRWDAIRDWPHFRRVVRALTRYDTQGRLATDARGEEVQAGFAIHAHGSGAGPLMPWAAANGTDFQDPRGTRALFADPGGTEAMQFLLDLYWKDHVSPAFRRQLSDEEVFNQGKVACVVAGTWSGKYIKRNTEGRIRFDQTAFPPGPRGNGHTTLTWGNMLVISSRSHQPELAWKYVKFVTSLEGSLRLLRHIEQNSPRKDFYESTEWRETCERNPYLWNVPNICASGRKLRHTQINAVDHAIRPIFETILLRHPDIEKGMGPYPSVAAGLEEAARAVNRVYGRYNQQVAYWRTKGTAVP